MSNAHRKIKVILAAGGSGGHIFPSIALAGELVKKGVEDIFFIASKRRLDMDILRSFRGSSFFLSINPMPFCRNPVKWIIFFFKAVSDVMASFFIIMRTRPDVVVGFGGYSSGSIARCATLLNIPLIIHEQNLLPGRANLILGKSADRIAVSFRETAEYFTHVKEKVFFSGNPLRAEMLSGDRAKAGEYFGLLPGTRTVLIVGGSQGATFLNRTASEAAGLICKRMGDKVQFIHLTGVNDQGDTKRVYGEKDIQGRIFAFLERMDHAYAIADIAISRAGAAAIFELASYGIPMILIPHPGKKNSQRSNAVYFSQKGAALYREEADINAAVLAQEVMEILDNPEKWGKMSENAFCLANVGAGERLAREVLSLAAGAGKKGPRLK